MKHTTIKETPLMTAVIEQLGYDSLDNEELIQSLSDITNHGIDGGFHGFIYHGDTVEFFNKNKKDILERCEQLASDLGEDMLTMIANFNCLKDQELTPSQVMAAIYEETDDSTQVKNALAWFAGEEIAREVVDH